MAEQESTARPPVKRKLPVPKWLLWTLGILVGLALILFIASFFIDEPLRKMTEKKVNRDLKGYTVRIPKLHLQLIGLSLTLRDLRIFQDAYPNPPVAFFPYLKASVHWREILSGKLVAEFKLDDPRLNINLPQLKHEVAHKDTIKQRGWQQALEDIYPLKINLLKINNASITYIDQDPKRPLSLTHLNIQADNIRNIHLPDKVYPSPFHLDTVIFGTGRGVMDGKANFLAEPTPGVKARLKLEKVPIDYFKPIVERANMTLTGGVLSANGDFEYAPKVQTAHLTDATISGASIEYIHSEKTAAAEKERAEKAKQTAKKVANKPQTLISVDKFSLTGSRLAMLNDEAGKRYRLFLSDADFILTNFSNQYSQGPAKARLTGKFMGSGATTVTGDFQTVKKTADIDLYIKITDTQLTSLNDLLRAYGKFDVAAGTFSLVTELHVKNNQVTGYIKPFFKDMKVYDRRQDKEKSLFKKAYELLVGGIAKLLENRPREQVATKADISGPLNQPQTSILQVVFELVRNAFIKAILPTFEREVTGMRK
jgi:hypothetical protein